MPQWHSTPRNKKRPPSYILIKGEFMHEAIALLRQRGFTVMIG